jgi:hypothetical protein
LHQDPASANCSPASMASRLRELAHQRIVDSFRAQLRNGGPGPSDEDLQSFARLAWLEHTLMRPRADSSQACRRAPGELLDRVS